MTSTQRLWQRFRRLPRAGQWAVAAAAAIALFIIWNDYVLSWAAAWNEQADELLRAATAGVEALQRIGRRLAKARVRVGQVVQRRVRRFRDAVDAAAAKHTRAQRRAQRRERERLDEIGEILREGAQSVGRLEGQDRERGGVHAAAVEARRFRGFSGSRSRRMVLRWAGICAVVLVAVIGANVLGAGWQARLDLTAGRQYTLSEQTLALCAELEATPETVAVATEHEAAGRERRIPEESQHKPGQSCREAPRKSRAHLGAHQVSDSEPHQTHEEPEHVAQVEQPGDKKEQEPISPPRPLPRPLITEGEPEQEHHPPGQEAQEAPIGRVGEEEGRGQNRRGYGSSIVGCKQVDREDPDDREQRHGRLSRAVGTDWSWRWRRRKIQPPNSPRSSQARSSATASGTDFSMLLAAAGYMAKVRALSPISLRSCSSDISLASCSATLARMVCCSGVKVIVPLLCLSIAAGRVVCDRPLSGWSHLVFRWA